MHKQSKRSLESRLVALRTRWITGCRQSFSRPSSPFERPDANQRHCIFLQGLNRLSIKYTQSQIKISSNLKDHKKRKPPRKKVNQTHPNYKTA